MTALQRLLLLTLVFAATTVQCSTAKSTGSDATVVTSTRTNAGIRGARRGSLQHQQQHSSADASNRQLKNDKDKDDNSSSGITIGNLYSSGISREHSNTDTDELSEPGACAPFALAGMQDRSRSALTDKLCMTNSCGSGCCRVYNWLICDTSNSFDHLQCICNENTAATPPPVPRPTMAPVTAQPATPAPTKKPPTAAAPVVAPLVAPTLPPNTSQSNSNYYNLTATDREDSAPPASTITTSFPGPTLAATTPAPVAVTPAPVPPAKPVPTAPWEQCLGGSSYHETASEVGKCYKSEDCQEKNECCIRNFCLCANAQGNDSECVPSRFN